MLARCILAQQQVKGKQGAHLAAKGYIQAVRLATVNLKSLGK
jgi:hypothetical protein